MGVREYATRGGASVTPLSEEEAKAEAPPRETGCPREATETGCQEQGLPSLFAFSPECNFSGRKYGLDLIEAYSSKSSPSALHSGCVTRGKDWYVLLDAAKHCATNGLDLSVNRADFVALSFYKMFGVPSGLGALIVSHRGASLLRKRYFGGGSITAASATSSFHQLRPAFHERFEDGSLPFLAISQLKHGFKQIRDLGIKSVAAHVRSCARLTAEGLSSLRHSNGGVVCRLLGRWGSQGEWAEGDVDGDRASVTQGSVVAFNLKRGSGKWIGYAEVAQAAQLEGIHIRTGLFCNPGAGDLYLGIDADTVEANLKRGHVCWDALDLIDGEPTGALRASFGYMSSIEVWCQLNPCC